MNSKQRDEVDSEQPRDRSSIDKWGYAMLVGVITLAWADGLRLNSTVAFALGFVMTYLVILFIEIVATRSERRGHGRD